MLRRLPPEVRRGLARAAFVYGLVLLLVNGAVNFFGRGEVFLLSPFHLTARVRALKLYALHRPRCMFAPHPPLPPLIAAAERRHGLPPELLLSLVEVESGLEVHRISSAGAVGPAQLLPSTARALGLSDPFDPEEAVEGSARYLAEQLKRFHDVRLAVAAYNAGPGAVNGAVPRNGETEGYVEQVTERYAWRRRAHAAR